MEEIFRTHLNKFVAIGEEEFAEVLKFFQYKQIKKKTNLLVEGQYCQTNYFVVDGLLRKFFVDAKGVEHTTEFALEGWWISDYMSLLTHSKSEFYIQAVEDCGLLCLSKENEEILLSTHPKMERYFRFIYQKAFAASQMRIKYLYEMSREELYYHFSTTQPDFLQRVPQYLIASYLGFTPEYLSEIRKRSLS